MTDNSINSRRIAKNSILLYGRMIIVMAIGLYSSRIVLRSLGVEDYGIYNLVGGLVVFFTIINSAMLSSTQRYINYGLGNSDKWDVSTIFHTAWIIHIILAVLIVFFAETIGLWLLTHKLQIPLNKADVAIFVFQISVITVVVQVLTIPYNAVLVAHEKMSVFAIISIVQSVLTLLVALSLLLIDSRRLWLYAILMCVVQSLVALFYFLYCRHHFLETTGRFVFEKNLFKEMISFAGWCMVGCTAGIMYSQGLNILLGMFFLPFVNAARGIAVTIQNAVSQVFNNVQTAVVPQLMQSYARKDFEYFNSLIFKSSKYFAFLLLFVGIPFFIRTPQILQLWLGEIPDYSVIFSRILICITLIDAVSAPLMRASDATGDIRKYHLVVGGVLLTIVPIAYIALKMGGPPESVFYVFFVISIFALVARLIILSQKINLSIKKFTLQVVFRIICVLMISFPICYVISQYIRIDFWGLVMFCCITTIVIFQSILFIGTTSTERAFIRNKISAVILKRI